MTTYKCVFFFRSICCRFFRALVCLQLLLERQAGGFGHHWATDCFRSVEEFVYMRIVYVCACVRACARVCVYVYVCAHVNKTIFSQ